MSKKQRAAAMRNLAKARSARRKGGRRRKRSRARRPAARRRRGGRRSRRVPGKLRRVRLHRYKGRYYQGRRGSLKGKTIRVNPPLIPTMGSVMNTAKQAGYGAAGYIGVSAIMTLVSRFGLLSWADSQNALVKALIRTGVRVLAVPVVAKVGGMVVSSNEARSALVIGASVNVGVNGLREIVGASGALPAWGNELLLGGTGDFLTMGDFVDSFGEDNLPRKTGGASPLVSAESVFA